MNLSLSENAIQYITEKIIDSDSKLVINIYQYTKQGCSGSYLDLYVEMDKEQSILKSDSHVKLYSLQYSDNQTLDIYLERRLEELFKEASKLLIDTRTHEKLGDKFTELILREED